MPASSGLPLREQALSHRHRALTAALALYAATTLVSMAVMSVGAVVAAVAIFWAIGPRELGHQLRSWIREPEIRRYFAASVALVLACALSTAVAWWEPLGWGGRFVHPAWQDLGKGWYFVWPFVLFAGLRRIGARGQETVRRAWWGAFAIVSVIGIAQYFTGWPRPQRIPSSPEHFHATMFLGHHLSVASILIFPFFACLGACLGACFGAGPGRSKPLESPSSGRAIWLVPVAVLGFAALFLSYSRMLWISLPIGLAIWAARALSRKQLLAALLAGAFAVGALVQSSAVRQRIVDGMGISQRTKLWGANLEFFRQRPLTGTGFRRNIEASGYYLESQPNDGWIFSGHAHNNLMDMLGGTGALGTLAWIAWCLAVFSILLRGLRASQRSRADFAWAMICAWIVFHLNGLTQVNFWEGKVMHQMMWAVAWSFFGVGAVGEAGETGETEGVGGFKATAPSSTPAEVGA